MLREAERGWIKPSWYRVEVLEHRAANVGHVVPDNLADLLPTALDFVLAR